VWDWGVCFLFGVIVVVDGCYCQIFIIVADLVTSFSNMPTLTSSFLYSYSPYLLISPSLLSPSLLFFPSSHTNHPNTPFRTISSFSSRHSYTSQIEISTCLHPMSHCPSSCRSFCHSHSIIIRFLAFLNILSFSR
jgi:hypothetical protein